MVVAINGLSTAPSPYDACKNPSTWFACAMLPIQAFQAASARPFPAPASMKITTSAG